MLLKIEFCYSCETVLLHGESEPHGELWAELKPNPRVHFMHRSLPNSVFGKIATTKECQSDAMRAEILYEYGGIYQDWDAIWTKPLTLEQRSYETVVTSDWLAQPNTPEVLMSNPIMALPRSRFITQVRREGVVGEGDLCFFCFIGYKVYERDPTIAFRDLHLSVIAFQVCFPFCLNIDISNKMLLQQGRYHPYWQEGASDRMFNGSFDWRTETNNIHFTFPTPLALRSKKALAKPDGNSIESQLGRFVMEKAGIKL